MCEPRAGERDAGRVVGIARVRKQHGRSALGGHEGQFDECRLRPGEDGHLVIGVEADAVDGRVPVRDRLLQLGQAAEGRVPVRAPVPDGGRELFDPVGDRVAEQPLREEARPRVAIQRVDPL